MRRRWASLCFLSSVIVAGVAMSASSAEERLICCGASEVFVIPADAETPTADDRIWRWTAADSPEIPEVHRPRFATTDDCKPYGDLLLITSSSQGVALVRRADKACLFFTLAANAHSACLLPGDRLAVASSTGGNALLIYDRRTSGAEATPLARLELAGAHGAWWDPKSQRLWALGDDELLKLELNGEAEKTTLAIDQRWPLPTPGGHDLSPSRDGRSLCITTNTHVYRFDLADNKFAPYDGLADAAGVKSVDEHPQLERTVYHQAAEPNWWSDRIRFAGSDRTIHLAGERLYKIRWDVPQNEP